jgi:hypothetical protein
VALVCVALVLTGAAAFSFVTLASTTLQLHSSRDYHCHLGDLEPPFWWEVGRA